MGMFTLNSVNGIKPGDLVRIHEQAPNSGMVPEMERFLSTVQKVDAVTGNSIVIGHFYWSVNDITHIKEPSKDPKKTKPVIFKEHEIVEV